MNYYVLDRELPIRLLFFVSIFAGMAIWEYVAPKRSNLTSKSARWFRNLCVAIIDSAALRVLAPATAVTAASYATVHKWGLFNNIELSGLPILILGLGALDAAIYFQHVMFHAVPLFWRLHKVHHTDLDFDVTTGVRFHPLEVMLSMGIKIGVVVFLGVPVPAVLLFEILLNGTSMFNHGNVAMPLSSDRWLRLFVVTPDMHRVHHSVIIRETNSNFGFNFPWWDRLFGTYRAQPVAGHDRIVIGIARYRDPQYLTLVRLLILPFLPEPK